MSNSLRLTALGLLMSSAATGHAAVQSDETNHAPHDRHEADGDHHHEADAADTIIVRATRSGRRVQDEPIRVEVIGGEEIAEKAAMRPGNISMLVAEMGGIRVQTTSPALGAANIRVQGLFGRYTQLLADGLPLYGGQTASLGLLQIPPTDLAQVEVIKGAASSLYGSSALGGVINLVSRRPGEEAAGEVLVNATTLDGQDLTGYVEAPLSPAFSASLTTGLHRQSAQDLDDDGFIDMASYDRVSVRPRFFWEGEEGATAYATVGIMSEQRDGGTSPGTVLPNGQPFDLSQDTDRFDSGFIGETPLGSTMSLNLRASAMVQEHEHRFGEVDEDDRHESYLLETSVSGETGRTDWVVGAAFQSEVYRSDAFSAFDYNYDVPGLFAQVGHDATDELAFSLSGRVDDHSVFGTQFSPRVSVLYKPGPFTVRGSVGEGFFAPTPFVEEIEAAGLSRLEPLSGLEEEQARTASLDVGYAGGPIEASVTVFASNVDGVTRLQPFASQAGGALDRVRLVNADGQTQIRGSEALLRYKWRDLRLTGSYLFLDATEPSVDGEGDRELALTPQHSAGFVAMWEQHGRGRLGFEAYYTGEQRLEDNPFRERSEPYWHLGLLGEVTVGQVSFFVNAENLLDIRQTKEDPLVLQTRRPSGQWTTDIWSRNDGFVLNGGIRLQL